MDEATEAFMVIWKDRQAYAFPQSASYLAAKKNPKKDTYTVVVFMHDDVLSEIRKQCDKSISLITLLPTILYSHPFSNTKYTQKAHCVNALCFPYKRRVESWYHQQSHIIVYFATIYSAHSCIGLGNRRFKKSVWYYNIRKQVLWIWL